LPRTSPTARPTPEDGRLDPRPAAIVALLVGLAVGVGIGALLWRAPALHAADFTGVWRGAGTLLRGRNPYTAIPAGLPYPLGPLAYPLPAVLVALPLGMAPAAVAGGIFSGVGVAVLLYAVLTRAPHRLLLFASPSLVMSASLVQWSPILTAAGMIGPLGALAVCKPNLGLALLARRPNRWMIGGGAVLLALSFFLVPSWLGDWLGGVRGMSYYAAPVRVPGGWILLLALLRWRDPDARLLTALSIIPSNLILYDQLPLFLIARNTRDTIVLLVGSWLATLLTPLVTPDWISDETVAQTYMRAPIVALVYLPALYLVLARPAPGGGPDVVDRVFNQTLARLSRSRRRRDRQPS
jgi:hypothetical protein